MKPRIPTAVIVSLFLAAVVCANSLVAVFGVAALPYTAFFMIPFDLVTRDALHDRWGGNHLALKMGTLLLVGGSLSALLSIGSLRIAMASMVAFIVAGTADALTYSIRSLPKRRRMLLSNLVGAFTDSLVFPALALGVISPVIMATQTAVKFSGSVLWIILLSPLLFTKHTNETDMH